MAEPILSDHRLCQPPPDESTAADTDPLPIPPLHDMFLSSFSNSTAEIFDLDLPFFDENCDMNFNLDDLDFCFPSENEHFSNPNSANSASPGSGSSGISADHDSDVAKYLNCSQSTGYQSSNSAAQLNSSSPVSSQVSGCGVSEAMNAASPDSGANAVVDQKIKIGDVKVRKSSLQKRKKGTASDDTAGDNRNQKVMRSENSNSKTDAKNSNSHCSGFVAVGEEDEKRKARLIRNRESAQLSRQRKKHHIEELEDKVRSMRSTIADLNGKISFFMAENASLRQQLNGNGMGNPPMYPPMAPMPYPYMHYAPYVVKPQGSQVPLVPIPRLKTASASRPKKSEAKKAVGKSKKVASVSFLGLLFFVLLFGGMVPILNVKYGGIKENGGNRFDFVSNKFYYTHKGRVLMVDGHMNGSNDKIDKIHCANLNDTKQLSASLYVPRNDKLVKIDGNLIIHSVLATEKAMASRDAIEVNKKSETSLAIPKGFSPALAIQRYRTSGERRNALPSRSSDTVKDHLKSSAANGKLQQQWFHEGLTGPLLSSGMCTEVFQFDSSPAPGAIVPASSVSNITTTKHKQNSTRHTSSKNRRFLHRLPIPLPGSDLNITGQQQQQVPSSPKDKFQGNNSSVPSSMVVSVLVDPREGGDIEVDGIIKPKSLSRIFVVVLLDSVKYVTYSCMLPLTGAGPHLVTT